MHWTSSTGEPLRKPATMNSPMCFGSGRAGRVRGHRVEPDRDRDRDRPVGRGEQVGTPVLVDLPVHEGRAAVDLLHPVHADVADARVRVARDHRRQRDERRRVAGPAAHDRQRVEVDVVAGERRPPGTAPFETSLGIESAIDLSLPRLRTLSTSPCGGCISSTFSSLAATSSRRSTPNARHMRRSVPNWLIRSGWRRALDLLEQERRPARLDDAVGDLGDLEIGVDLGRDADELTLALEERDPLAQVGDRRGHRGPQSRRGGHEGDLEGRPYSGRRLAALRL